MPARRRPPAILTYEHRVYFRDKEGTWWRVYDITVGPDERSNPRRYALTPPDTRAIYREFVNKAGEWRRYIFNQDSRPGVPLHIPPLLRQLREAKIVRPKK